MKSFLACAKEAILNPNDDQAIREFNDILEDNEISRIQLPKIEYMWILTLTGQRNLIAGIFPSKKAIEQAIKDKWIVGDDCPYVIRIEEHLEDEEMFLPRIHFDVVTPEFNPEIEESYTALRIPYNNLYHISIIG